jgi:hypothetical protein
MDTTYQIVVSNPANLNPLALFVDATRPKDASRCFICVGKVNGGYQVNPAAVYETLELHCDAVINSFRGTNTNALFRSDLLDAFITTNFQTEGQNRFAFFDVQNNDDNWMEISMSQLNNLSLTFASGIFGQKTLKSLNIHLKLKFQ